MGKNRRDPLDYPRRNLRYFSKLVAKLLEDSGFEQEAADLRTQVEASCELHASISNVLDDALEDIGQ